MLRRKIPAILLMVASTLLLSAGCNHHHQAPSVDSTIADTPHQHQAHAHGRDHSATSDVQLLIRSTPQTPVRGDPVELALMLHDSQGRMLKDFETIHEKKAHLILISDGLDEFAHLHPLVDRDGNLRVTHIFSPAGSYHVFVDYKPTGQSPATSRTTFTVAGEKMRTEPLAPDAPGTVQGDGLQAKIAIRDSIGGSQIVSFQIQERDQSPAIDLDPFLRAMGHLVVVSAKGTEYVHSHPLTETSAIGTVEFDVHFPRPGVHKLWGQFQRGGRVHTIPAVIDAGNGARVEWRLE